VKKKFAQVVIAMGDHGYLELEGGQLMVEFIVKQCALSPESAVSSQPLKIIIGPHTCVQFWLKYLI
jgi:hypothetical protein